MLQASGRLQRRVSPADSTFPRVLSAVPRVLSCLADRLRLLGEFRLQRFHEDVVECW